MIWLEAAAAALVGVALLLVVLGPLISREVVPAIVIATLDNLIKGASGLAVQDMNIMLGFPETEGLMQLALFP